MKTNIKVLGTGCPKCKTTIQLIEELISENNLDFTVEKVDDIMKIMEYNVMSTPAVVINEKIVIKGRVPSKAEILELLKDGNTDKNETESGCCGSNTTCC